MNSRKFTPEEKAMLECDASLEKITKKIEKKYDLDWEKANEMVCECFRRLCCTCWIEEDKKNGKW